MKSLVKNFINKIVEEFTEIRFAAASLAFSTLFALIPFLVVVLAFFQAFGGLEKYYPEVEALLLSYLKEATGSTVTQYLKGAIYQVQARTLGISSLLILAISNFGLLRSLDVAVHKIWKIKITKPYYVRMWLYSLILLLTPLFVGAFIGLKSVDYFRYFSQTIEHQFLVSVTTTFVLWVMYTIIPSTKVSLLASLAPAILASAALSIVQNSFLWASLKLFKQNKIYGSLASFPIFLLWLLVVWYIILTGVSFCAFLQQKIFKRS